MTSGAALRRSVPSRSRAIVRFRSGPHGRSAASSASRCRLAESELSGKGYPVNCCGASHARFWGVEPLTIAILVRDEESDRLAVECDCPAFGAALSELYFQAEDGRYVRRFPPNSVTETVFARFQANLLPLLRQTARLDPAPWGDALRETARRLDRAGVDWWLTGSAALAVRGLPVSPRDLDLVVSDADARRACRVGRRCYRSRRPARANRLRPGRRRSLERSPVGRPGDPHPAA